MFLQAGGCNRWMLEKNDVPRSLENSNLRDTYLIRREGNLNLEGKEYRCGGGERLTQRFFHV